MKLRMALVSAAALVMAGSAAASSRSEAETLAPQGAAVEVAGVITPTGALAAAAAQTVRSAEGELVYQHSLRVYHWAALAATRQGLAVDPQLLYVAALFHDDGAAREFLVRNGVSEHDAQRVWLAIALHTTNRVPAQLEPGLADVLAYKDPSFRRRDFSALVRTSRWTAER